MYICGGHKGERGWGKRRELLKYTTVGLAWRKEIVATDVYNMN